DRVERLLRVVAGGEPDTDLRAGGGYERVGRLARTRRVDAEDGDRRLGPEPVHDPSGADQLRTGQDAGLRTEAVERGLRLGGLATDQPRDGDVAGVVVQGGEEAYEGGQRVGYRPAERPAVYGVVEHAYIDEEVHQAAQ